MDLRLSRTSRGSRQRSRHMETRRLPTWRRHSPGSLRDLSVREMSWSSRWVMLCWLPVSIPLREFGSCARCSLDLIEMRNCRFAGWCSPWSRCTPRWRLLRHGPQCDCSCRRSGRSVSDPSRPRAVAEAARAQRIDVIDLGRFELRHITEPVELFELDCGLDAGDTPDPVCRMRVGRDHAIATVRYGGSQYWFCSLECARRFTAAPTSFLRSS